MTLTTRGTLETLARRGVLAIASDLLVIGTLWAPAAAQALAMSALLGSAGFGAWCAVRQRRADPLWWVGALINAAAVAVVVGLGISGMLDPND